MIIGSCPGCDVSITRPLMEGKLPAFERTTCEACDEVLWIRHSRFLAEVWDDDAFFEEFTVGPNKEVKRIKPDLEEEQRIKGWRKFLGLGEFEN